VLEPAVAWHADLSWVPAFLAADRPSAAERSLLRAVNGFLGAGGSNVIVPLRERSLQLTGDEKMLDTVSRGRLFAPGRLSLELLSAARVSPRLIRQEVGLGSVLLLVENYATYHSLTATLPADSEVGAIIDSAGNTLGVVLTALADQEGRPEALAYFGTSMCADWRSRRPAHASPRSWGYLRSTRRGGCTGSCSTTDVRHRQALIPARRRRGLQ
jgi:hypothetical protein